MVYSASSARTLLEGEGDGTAFLIKYLASAGVGLALMHLLSRHGLASVRRLHATDLSWPSSCSCSCSCRGWG